LIAPSTTPSTYLWTQQTRQGTLKGKEFIHNTLSLCVLNYFILFRPELVATWPLPSSRDVGHPVSISIDFYANHAGFRAPTLIKGCRLHFEGAGQMWKGTRGETQQVRRGRCCHFDTFRDFYFTTAELIFCEYRRFRKPVKHVVSPPTSTLLHDNHQSRQNMSFRHPHPPSLTTTTATPAPSKLRPCNWANALPPGVGGILNGCDGRVGAIEATGPCPRPKTVIRRGSSCHPLHVYAGEVRVGVWFAHL